MKQVILLRHAKSSWDDPKMADHDRPLNPRGINAANLVGKYFKDKKIIPDIILCSTSVRTRMTLDLILEDLKVSPVIHFKSNIYDQDLHTIIKDVSEVENKCNRVLIVGHNPGIEELVKIFSHPQPFTHKFSTGAFAVIEFDIVDWSLIKEQTGQILLFKTPKMIN